MSTLILVNGRFWRLIVACLLLLAVPALAQQPTTHEAKTKPLTVVYKLKTDRTAARAAANDLPQALKQIGASNVHQKFPQAAASTTTARRASETDITRIYQATYSSELSFEQVQRALLATGQVAYAEPVYLREPFHAVSDPFADSTKTTAYYLKLVKAYGAWDITHGDTNVVIGVIDTGFRIDHQDLKNNIKYNYADPIDGIDNDNDGYTDNFAGWDFADNDNNVQSAPRWGSHGMMVAGVAGATPDNATGVAGIGYSTKILPLKVFSSSSDGAFGGGYDAIVYAVRKGCKIINLSWGGEGFSQYEQDIINYAVLDNDVVIVSAGGNVKRKANYYPASYANVLSVAGSDRNDNKYTDYTWSHYIDLMAPSIDIYSTTATSTSSYGYGWGSSFASPMVAGAAALVRARYPELNAQQVMERIRVTTDPTTGQPANQPYFGMIGTGRLNIKKALKLNNLKAARCTTFGVAGNRSAQAGSTVPFLATFQNILDPVSNLYVSLSSASPYVTIANPNLSLGSMATMATADNHQDPFQVTISPDVPLNTTIAFRLYFTDGDYRDFQYFEITVNPEFHTLDANDLRITVNSKGNLGYDGLNFTRGVGMQYKGSSSLLFEGGLMIGTSPERVSDNLRNAQWQNDGDFTVVKPARINYSSAVATQEVRGVFQDIYPSTSTVGVEVVHRSLAWNSAADQDYIIQEFIIKNVTADTLKNVATALFADWDIGVYYQNAADWDDSRKLGYAYNLSGAYPLAGIKLLTPQAPVYYAIDNLGEAGSIAVEDGFTNAEKYALMANGVARTKANGFGNGNNVSHVVGGKLGNLAPGASQTITFAILSGDNLEALQQHADAAQQKYVQIKSGPVPVAIHETICQGGSFTWEPGSGTNYRFYADADKQTLLGEGAAYTIEDFSGPLTLYAANADSLFESAVSPATFSLPQAPEADFEVETVTIFAETPVQFLDKSTNSASWYWEFAPGATSFEQNPVFMYQEQGKVTIQLHTRDESGCLEDSISKTFIVRAPLSENEAERYAQMTDVFPNPAKNTVHINWAADASAGTTPAIWFTDQVGRKFTLPVKSEGTKDIEFDVSNLANGLYIAHFTYRNTNFIKRIVVLR
ncbi:S8 family serine peptidase [Pontibacter sp. Tf4]|uniref:S8 family serine peptidase n=1 Tax=Pontibacter sp. Tf4 TaxID=2761620 RepID=UPI001624F5C3|nr:S8 family serine peptidase [Pontibacter sp. Tf4]MBB6610812.1 S8 family serine peptidase [Pontibacter sp. Tf4]